MPKPPTPPSIPVGPAPEGGGRPSSPRRRERCDALENRAKLLAAARHLFASQGVEATEMQEVARAAGVGQGTLYRHFTNKGELCAALIRDDLGAFMARVDADWLADRAASPLAALEQLIADQIGLAWQHLPLLAAIEEAGGHAGPRGPRSPWRQWLRGHVTRLLARAAVLGEVERDVDVEYAAEALLTVLSPRFLGFQRNELGYALERTVTGTRRVFVEGLRAGGATVHAKEHALGACHEDRGIGL